MSYDWTPPFEALSWSMGEAEVMEILGLNVAEAQSKHQAETQEVLSFSSAMETKFGDLGLNDFQEGKFGC